LRGLSELVRAADYGREMTSPRCPNLTLRRLAPALAAALALIPASASAAVDPATAVRQAAQTWIAQAGTGNPHACSLMTSRAQASLLHGVRELWILQHLKQLAAQHITTDAGANKAAAGVIPNCAAAMRVFARAQTKRVIATQLALIARAKITVRGAHATLTSPKRTVDGKTVGGPLAFVNLRGRWLVNS
jgi:hypothetical protein